MQKDLGEKTAEIASVIDTYLADGGWEAADGESAGSASCSNRSRVAREILSGLAVSGGVGKRVQK